MGEKLTISSKGCADSKAAVTFREVRIIMEN